MIVESIPFTRDELIRKARMHLLQYSHVPELRHSPRARTSPNDLIYYLAKALEQSQNDRRAA